MAFGDVYTGKESFKSTYKAPRGGNSLTLNQTIAQMIASDREKNRSFLGKVFGGGKGALTFGIRQIMRPSLAVTTGIYEGLEGKGAFDIDDFYSGLKSGFMLKDTKTGSNILTELGWSGGGLKKSIAGFGIDVLTDPTLPLQVGATILSGGTAAPAFLAGRAALTGFAKAGATASVKHAAAADALRVLETAGEEFSQRKGLAMLEKHALKAQMTGRELSEREAIDLSFAQRAAKEEEKAHAKSAFQLAYNIPFSGGKKVPLTPTQIGGKRIAPLVPSLNRTAGGEGLLAKVPGMAAAATATGKVFRHGFDEEEWAKPLLQASHVGQKLNDGYIKVAHEFLGPHKALSTEARKKALDWASQRLTLVTRNARGVGTLNKAELGGAVERGALTKAEADFVNDWHNYWEYMAQKDKQLGVKYDKQLGNKIYIPHIYAKDGGMITKSDIAAAGFSKERVDDLTLSEMDAMSKSKMGQDRKWVSDPMQIAAIRTRRGAQAQARELLLRHMRRSTGVPSRVENPAKYKKYEAKLKEAEATFAKYEWSVNSRKVGARRAAITRKFKDKLDKKRGDINLKFKPQYAALRTAHNRDMISDEFLVKEVERLNKAEATAHKTAEKQILGQQQNAIETLDRSIEHSWKQLEYANQRTERIQKLLDRGFTMRNPHIPEGWQKLSRKLDGEYYHFPPALKASMSRVETVYKSEAEQTKLVGAWDRAMASWKVGVTSINPGYRVRNTLSDVWNMYIAGVPAWAIPVYAKRADSLQRSANNIEKRLYEAVRAGVDPKLTAKEQKVLRTMLEAHSHGILSGLFGGDVLRVAQLLNKGVYAKDALRDGKVLAAYTRMMGNWNRRWEDKGRLTHYLYRREYEKMGVADSADWVKKAHFDYSELSPTEQEKFKKILPFYTWTRKNLPYQMTQIVARPGKFATFPKVLNTADEIATEQDGEMAQPGLLPEWLGERMAFRVPGFGGNAMAMPLIGVTDLTKLDNPLSIVGMEAPWIKAPIEIATGKSLFTGQPITDGAGGRSPVSGAAASLFSMIPGSNVGTTGRNVDGEMQYGAGANPWFAYAAGQLPLTNFLVNQMSSIKRQQRGGTVLPVIGYVGGVAVYDRDLEAEVAAAQIETREEVQNIIRNLRRSGKLAPAEKKKVSSFDKRLQEILKGG